MRDTSLLGPWIRRFLMEHIPGERNLARNTQRSYRDTLRLLLPPSPSVGPQADRPTRRSMISRPTACARSCSDLEEKRGCGIATRNQRLAAIHALARFIGLHASPSGSIGAGRSVRCRSRSLHGRWSLTWRRWRWTPCSRRRTCRQPRAVATMPCCCSCITPAARADEAAQARIEDLELTSCARP